MEYNSEIMVDCDAATNTDYTRSNDDATDRCAYRKRSSIKQTFITSSITPSTPLSVPTALAFFPLPPSRCKYKRPSHIPWMYLFLWFCYSSTCKCLVFIFFVSHHTFYLLKFETENVDFFGSLEVNWAFFELNSHFSWKLEISPKKIGNCFVQQTFSVEKLDFCKKIENFE